MLDDSGLGVGSEAAGGSPARAGRTHRGAGQNDLSDESDEALLARVRDRSVPALEELFRRHRRVALRYARRLTSGRASWDMADDVVGEATRRVLSALDRGYGPDRNFRGYLLTSVRAAAITMASAHRESTEGRAVHDTPPPIPGDGTDTLVAMSAFASLPDRWRRVLWATEALDLGPVDAAALLHSTPAAVAMMAMRARDALRVAYVREHLPTSSERACRRALDLIARSSVLHLTRSQRSFFDGHVMSCVACERAQRQLDGHLREWAGAATWVRHDLRGSGAARGRR